MSIIFTSLKFYKMNTSNKISNIELFSHLKWLFNILFKNEYGRTVIAVVLTSIATHFFNYRNIASIDKLNIFDKSIDVKVEALNKLRVRETDKFNNIKNATTRYYKIEFAIFELLDIKYNKIPSIRGRCKNEEDLIREINTTENYIKDLMINGELPTEI